jgi:hypothetical protein
MALKAIFMIFKKDKTDREFRIAWHTDFDNLSSAEFRVHLLKLANPDTEYQITEARKHNRSIC